jgi:hypothetical protein
MKSFRIVFPLLVFVFLSCKKPYIPPASSTPNNYLVVEGIINSGNDSTIIKISKTVKLTDQTTNNPVTGATVTVEGETSGSYPLNDNNGIGQYASAGLNLPSTQRYRLRINAGSSSYLSDYVETKPTPAIDSVGYNIQNGNANLYVNTHDPSNNTRYYRWEYEETWEFHSKYYSDWVVDASVGGVRPRTQEELIYYCFTHDNSSHIILNSTEKLAKDVVYQSPLIQIPLTSEKVEMEYSILVRQYAVTKEAYIFYQNIQKNSEQLGDIFSPQPTEISGNIHCLTNPAEPVVGYVAVGTVQSKRIFVHHDDLPGNVQPIYPYDCQQDTALFQGPYGINQVEGTLVSNPGALIPTSAVYKSGVIGPIGYLYSSPECVDCTIRGGLKPPAWWQ